MYKGLPEDRKHLGRLTTKLPHRHPWHWDAWPPLLIQMPAIGQHTLEWDEFYNRIQRGNPKFEPRVEAVPKQFHAPLPNK